MRMVEVYNKAIRDKIPEIIEQSGRKSKTKRIRSSWNGKPSHPI